MIFSIQKLSDMPRRKRTHIKKKKKSVETDSEKTDDGINNKEP